MYNDFKKKKGRERNEEKGREEREEEEMKNK
jgi:hypothetical protein